MDDNQYDFRKVLRRSQTDVEKLLWKYLRGSHLGKKFKRQIIFGNYIVDFYCPGCKFVIELDGEQHKQRREYDDIRTKYLKSKGIKVIRFWNGEVESNIEGVLERIRKALTPRNSGASLS